MSSEKFVICPHCGAIVEKKDTFCGTCGKNVLEPKKESFESTHTSTSFSSQGNDQTNNSQQHDYQPFSQQNRQQIYYVQPQTYVENQIEEKLKMAWLFAWLTACMVGNTLFLIITVYFAIEAKKLGSEDSKIRISIIIAIASTVVWTTISILLYIFIWLPVLLEQGF